MKCPFELPVYRVIKSDRHGYYAIRSVMCASLVCDKLTKKQADYIVQAINSYEKFKETLFEVARQAITKYDPNAQELPKNRFANELVEKFEQALEAEI